MKTNLTRRHWYEWIPHPIVMLFIIIIVTTILSYILPAGVFEREMVDGRQRVVPGSYQRIEATPIGLMDMFKALPMGFKTASDIIFLVFASGVMFGMLEKSGMVENTVGTIVRQMGDRKRFLLVVLMTYIYGLLGIMIGFENNIAMVPIAAVMILALGGDLVLAAGVSVGAITVGFGLSPINPYTVGTGHNIAELPLFSGAWLRSILSFIGLSLLAWHNVRYFKRILADESSSLGKGLNTEGMTLSKPLQDYTISPNNRLVLGVFLTGMAITLYGIFKFHWYINDLSGVFIMIAIASAAAAGMNGTQFSETAFQYIGKVAPGAFMVGYATTIKEVMEMGNISDTISHELSQVLMTLPTYASAVFMSISQCAINLVIPSGSGQALATLPIMIPLGELLGLTRQTTILAFQIGDGVTNLFNPALGGLVAMLSLCRVPFDRWLRFIFPVTGMILLIAWLFLIFSVYIGYGPA